MKKRYARDPGQQQQAPQLILPPPQVALVQEKQRMQLADESLEEQHCVEQRDCGLLHREYRHYSLLGR